MNPKVERILVASSLTEASEEVVRVGFALAAAGNAEVHLIHVALPPLHTSDGVFGFGTAVLDGELLRAEEEVARERLGEQAARLGAGRPAVVHVGVGSPHRAIAELAGTLAVDLLVVGAAERGPVLERLLGSTANRLLGTTPCPVLIVRPGFAVPPKKVLAPVDLSPLSGSSLRRATSLLAAFGGATSEIEALFVLSSIQRQAPQFSPEQMDHFAAEELERFLAREGGGEKIAQKVRCGGPREEIVEEAKEGGADLIAIGSHGLGGFDRWVIGSVSADVARRAPVSVLVVPPLGSDSPPD